MRVNHQKSSTEYGFFAAILVAYRFLSGEEQRKALGVFFLLLCSAILEVVGIFSIMPFMALVANPSVMDTPTFQKVSHFVGITEARDFLLFTGLGVLALLALGNAFTIFSLRQLTFFTNFVNHSLSMRLVEACFDKPYSFFVQEHSSKIGVKVLSEVSSFVSGYLRSLMEFAARGLVAIMICSMLLLVNPFLALQIALGLALVYTIITLWFRKKIRADGELRTNSKIALYKLLQEVFAGIREVKLYGVERFFYRSMIMHSENLSWSNARTNLVAQTPRYIVEVVAFGGIISIVLAQIVAGNDAKEVIPLLSLYAVAGYRLLPAFQGAFANFTQARFHANTVSIVEDELTALKTKKQSDSVPSKKSITKLAFGSQILLKIQDFRYETSEAPVLQDMEVSIRKGEAIAIVGPTGSGKSTLVDILVGLLPIKNGSLAIDGKVLVGDDDSKAWQNNVGYISQAIFILDDTVKRNVAFGIPDEQIDLDRVIQAAKAAQIHDFIVSDLPQSYDTVVGERGLRLSGGQRQRLGIARALYRDSEVIVLDEATSALDSKTESSVMSALQGVMQTKTLVLITHRLSTVKNFPRVLLIDKGRVIADGPVEELIATNETFRDLWLSGR